MASVYKSMSGTKSNGASRDGDDDGKPKNRQRLLMLSSRGVTYRRKDAKLDTKTQLTQLNELADLYNCNNVMFFEARKGQDLYIWLSKPPNGPTVKLHCQNIHTMEELNFTGNCLKGSRPILSFDANFDKQAHTKLLKELLTQAFGVPPGSRRTKPFVDHVMGFTLAEGKVWIRVYQIGEAEPGKAKPGEEANALPTAAVSGDTSVSLIEIGPRLVLTPIVTLEGSFGGPVIYENKQFISPNQIRSELRRKSSSKFAVRSAGQDNRKVKKRELGLNSGEGPRTIDELDDQRVFA